MKSFLFGLLLVIAVCYSNCKDSTEVEVCSTVGQYCYSKNAPCCDGLICHGVLSWRCKECIPAGGKCSDLMTDQYEKPCCGKSQCKEVEEGVHKCVTNKSNRRSLADYFSD